MARPLRVLISELTAGHSAGEIQKLLDISGTWVSQVHHGKMIPRNEQLVTLAKKYAPGSPERLGELLSAAAFARLEAEKFADPGLQEDAKAAWHAHMTFTPKKQVQSSCRTLKGFPDSFYPLAVVSGDKREDSESRINAADFGVVSASPAESRWVFQLGLNRDVEFYSDKIFVLEDHAQLKRRFKDKNLLVIGSPGSNHLARKCHLACPPEGWRRSVPVFRFNILQEHLVEIERFLKGLEKMSAPELVGIKAKQDTAQRLKFWLHALFCGGIVDPTYHGMWLRGQDLWNVDFGLITMARNPFAETDQYVCIMCAGFHLFGTAHAVRAMAQVNSSKCPFENHPLGGVIRVNFDQSPFGRKFDESTSAWDVNSLCSIEDLEKGLSSLSKRQHAGVHISPDEAAETLQFVKSLCSRS